MTAPTLAPPAASTCPHTPPCPPATAPDRDAAHVVADHHDQGWIRLCNGVIVFDDTGETLPDGRSVPAHRPEPLHVGGAL